MASKGHKSAGDEVCAKLMELQALEQNLDAFVKHCDTACVGGPGGDCVVFKDLNVPRHQCG